MKLLIVFTVIALVLVGCQSEPPPTSQPSATPTPEPKLRVTSAPAGPIAGNWHLIRQESASAVTKWSADGNMGARLVVQCQISEDIHYVSVLYNEPFFSITSGAQETRVSIDGSVKIEQWYLFPDGERLTSLDSEGTVAELQDAELLRVTVTVGLEQRWSLFELTGIQDALLQLHSCA